MSEAVPEEPDEPVEDDEEPEDEPEDEPEEPEEPSSYAVVEGEYKDIEVKKTNYAKAQAKLLAVTGVPWSQCPLCDPFAKNGVAGFILPYDPEDVDDQLRKLNVDSYFHATEPEYKPAEDREECPKCDGWGQVLSGSRAEAHRVVPCSRCNGTGFVVKADESLVYGTIPPPPPPTPSLSALANGPEQGPDVFGRPAGHKDYGVPPAYVNA